MLRVREFADTDHGGDLFFGPDVEQVHYGLAACSATCFRDLIHLLPIQPSALREEEDIVVRVCNEHALDVVFLFRAHAGDTLASTSLSFVGVYGDALDIAGMADGDNASPVRH